MVDIPSFLRTYPPFDALDEETLARVVQGTEIAFFPAGEVILQRSGEPARAAYVVRSGAVELLDGDGLVDLLGPGELFGHPSLTAGTEPSFTVRAYEDSLCYLIDAEVMEDVLGTREGLTFLSASLRRRMVRALEGLEADRADPWRIDVERLIRREPISCESTATVREAAEMMALHRISSVLVPVDGEWGIVTDRDLRSRVLAAGLGGETRVSEIMTRPVRTVPVGSPATEVLRLMLELGIHHLPVVDVRGVVVGVVTDTDLMGLERRTPFALRSAIERASDRDGAVAAARELPGAVCDLVEASADPIDVGHVVGVTVDALTRRLTELAIDELGSPPASWAWLGSEARHEQALATDQDHALAYDAPEDGDADSYFADLAERVASGLEAAGIPRCKAGVSASRPGWRLSVDGWRGRFSKWMRDTGPEGGQLASIAFDYRRVAGPLDIEAALDEVVRESPRRSLFLRRVAQNAILGRPPVGFFGNLVVEAGGEHAGTLDVKGGGIMPVTAIARTHALVAGLTAKRTLDRLAGAAAAGLIEEGDRAALDEAFRLLWLVRLEHQASRVKSGGTPDDFVDPGTLGPLTRAAVKEGFRAIDRAQRELALNFDLRR